MSRRNHMIPCAIIALVAMVFLALSGSALGAGLGLALLLCPLLMGTVMWLLMSQPKGSAVYDEHTHPVLRDHAQHVSRSAHP